MHSDEAARMFDHLLQLFHPFSGQVWIPGPDVFVEFGANRMVYGFSKPSDYMLLEPRDIFLVELDLQQAFSCGGIIFIGEQNTLELERDHAAIRVIGHKEPAIGVVQIVGVVCSVVGDRFFDPLPFGNQSWRCIERGIEASDAA